MPDEFAAAATQPKPKKKAAPKSRMIELDEIMAIVRRYSPLVASCTLKKLALLDQRA